MEAGEGEEGRDCLLETQEESPSASSQASPACPLQPPPNFSSSSAHQGAATEPRAWCRQTSLRPASLQSGCCLLATWRLIQSPSTF